jgi:murein L,D-transpeptidase YcbB/YkuD
MNAIFLPSLPRSVYEQLFQAVAKISLTLHLIRLRAQSVIARIEADMDTAKKLIENAWIIFLELAERVQRAGVWRLKARTWHKYCRRRWNIDSSRISQLRTSLPYASAILSVGAGSVIEGHIKQLKKRVPVDSPKMLAAWELGNSVARAEKRAPTEALYGAAHEVLLEAEETGGKIQIGEAVYYLGDSSQAIEAVQARIREIQKVAMEGQPHKLVEFTARQREDGLWEIESQEELPKVIKSKTYI